MLSLPSSSLQSRRWKVDEPLLGMRVTGQSGVFRVHGRARRRSLSRRLSAIAASRPLTNRANQRAQAIEIVGKRIARFTPNTQTKN
jgi:hypothetical protein